MLSVPPHPGQEGSFEGPLVLPDLEGAYSIFLADLHLSGKTPALNRAFCDLLTSDFIGKADRLYILGDLFDFWLGDEMLDEAPYGDIVSTIAKLSDKGVSAFFMVGNRDFLVGQRFYRFSRMTALDDPVAIDLYGKKTLISHGDLFCTGDKKYQKFRKDVRNPIKRLIFLALPITIRSWIYRRTLRKIAREQSRQPTTRVDVEVSTILDYQSRFSANRTIHGHTHNPAVHETAASLRLVIPDWRIGDDGVIGGFVIATPAGLTLHHITRRIQINS
jgi:UDP-2,3-diacylglucosamine hydrolase